jgi:TIR domain
VARSVVESGIRGVSIAMEKNPTIFRAIAMAQDVTIPRVFLSYCRDDLVEVSRLRADLAAHGIEVWWDRNILPGQDWKYEIREAMKRSCAVILCLSGQCLERTRSFIYPEVLDAIAAYRERRPGEVFLIPVRLSECEIPSIEIDDSRTLDRLHFVDLFPPDRWDEGVRSLLEALNQSSTPQHRSQVTRVRNIDIAEHTGMWARKPSPRRLSVLGIFALIAILIGLSISTVISSGNNAAPGLGNRAYSALGNGSIAGDGNVVGNGNNVGNGNIQQRMESSPGSSQSGQTGRWKRQY